MCWKFVGNRLENEVNTLPSDHAHRVLDCLFHEGHTALFRTGLAILSLRSEDLLRSDSVVEAYSFLRQPFGLDERVVSEELSALELPAKDLIDRAFGPWLRGFRLEQRLREQFWARVAADDAQAAARKEAWRQLRSQAEELLEPRTPSRTPLQSAEQVAGWMTFVRTGSAQELASPIAEASPEGSPAHRVVVRRLGHRATAPAARVSTHDRIII